MLCFERCLSASESPTNAVKSETKATKSSVSSDGPGMTSDSSHRASIFFTHSNRRATLLGPSAWRVPGARGTASHFNMRKPLSIGMFVRARFETGLFRFPSGGPAHAAWLSRRLPGKLISAGSCGCASGGQPGMSAHPTAFRFSVRRDRANPVFCRARPGGCP